jgi:hypothetical protein
MAQRQNFDPLTRPRPQGRYKEQYGVIVVCKDEREQRRVYRSLRSQGFVCKVVCT